MSQLCVLRPGGHREEWGALSKLSLPPTFGDKSLNSTAETQRTVFMFLLQFSQSCRGKDAVGNSGLLPKHSCCGDTLVSGPGSYLRDSQRQNPRVCHTHRNHTFGANPDSCGLISVWWEPSVLDSAPATAGWTILCEAVPCAQDASGQCDNPNCLQTLPSIPLGDESTPVNNH